MEYVKKEVLWQFLDTAVDKIRHYQESLEPCELKTNISSRLIEFDLDNEKLQELRQEKGSSELDEEIILGLTEDDIFRIKFSSCSFPLIAYCVNSDKQFCDCIFGSGKLSKKDFYQLGYFNKFISCFFNVFKMTELMSKVIVEAQSCTIEDLFLHYKDVEKFMSNGEILHIIGSNFNPDTDNRLATFSDYYEELSDMDEKSQLVVLEYMNVEPYLCEKLKLALSKGDKKEFETLMLQEAIEFQKSWTVAALWNRIQGLSSNITPSSIDNLSVPYRSDDLPNKAAYSIYAFTHQDSQKGFPVLNYLEMYNYFNRIIYFFIYLHDFSRTVTSSIAAIFETQDFLDNWPEGKALEQRIQSNEVMPSDFAIDELEEFYSTYIDTKPKSFNQDVAPSVERVSKVLDANCYASNRRKRVDMESLYDALIKSGYIKETSTHTKQSFLYYLADDYNPQNIELEPIQWVGQENELFRMIDRLDHDESPRWAKTAGSGKRYKGFFIKPDGERFDSKHGASNHKSTRMDRLIDDLFPDTDNFIVKG